MLIRYLLCVPLFLIGCGQGQNNSGNRRAVQLEAGSAMNDAPPPSIDMPPPENSQNPGVKSKLSQLDAVATGLAMTPIPVAAIRTVAVNKDGSLIAMGNGEGEIAIWSEAEGKYVHNWVAHDHWVFDLVFDSNSKKLISAGGDNLTKIWAVDGWKELHSFADHDDDVHGAAITADSRLLITVGDDMNVVVRDLNSGKVTKLQGHEAQVTSVVLSPDGKRAYSSSRDQTIRVWDLEKLAEVAVLEGHEEDVLHLALDRSGDYLASASYDGTVKIWSTEKLAVEKTLVVPDVWMLAVEFSKDASIVFTGSKDGLVRAFDRKTTAELWQTNATSAVSDLVLMPSGKRFIASTSASGMNIYDFTPNQVATVRHVTRQKTPPPVRESITTQEYLNMHNALLFEQDTPDWGKRVGLLAIHGDIWTRYLLEDLETESLLAPKQELARRLRDKLQARPLWPAIELGLGAFWGRLAVAEQHGMRIAQPLKEWVETETREWKDQTENQASELLLIEKQILIQLKSLDQTSQDSKTIEEVNEEILKRLHAILDE